MGRLWVASLILMFTAMAATAGENPSPAKSEPRKPGVEVIDESFKTIVAPDAEVREIAKDLKFTEGPTWYAAEKCVLLSDIPADIIYKWTEADGLKVWRQPSHNANGNAVDPQGRLVSCEHTARGITRTGKDGKVETLCSTYQGKKLSSPNDVVVKSDGTVWFTDPPYGVPKGEQKEQDKNRVYRLDPGAKEPVSVVDDFNMPNGLAFSPDEKFLYIADSGKPHHIRRFAVKADNTLEGGDVFVTISPGGPDGIRCDRAGRLFSSAGDGVQVFTAEGKLIGKIRTPLTAANLCFGGPEGKTLFITARTSVWAVNLLAPSLK
ncbi:MAG: SMP-30/gluconolactonase/LRE family protein [Planctomycetota bacterium]|nr:SMP-30/gluconolactonase/LRE family protein [Planctomycetota bacterium]